MPALKMSSLKFATYTLVHITHYDDTQTDTIKPLPFVQTNMQLYLNSSSLM